MSDQVPKYKQRHPFQVLVNDLSVEAYMDYSRMSLRDSIEYPVDGIKDHSTWVNYALRVVNDIKKIMDHSVPYLNGMSKANHKRFMEFAQRLEVITTVVANSARVQPSFNFDPLNEDDQDEFMLAIENNINAA